MQSLNRHFSLEWVRVTEAAALSASAWIGRGDGEAADRAATLALRDALNALNVNGFVVNGPLPESGELLCAGERLGRGVPPRIDISLNAIEGATICAKGTQNALSVVAVGCANSFLPVPDGVYMDKIAIGPRFPAGVVNLDWEPAENLARFAAAKGCLVSDVVVCMLDRPRNAALLKQVYAAGARVVLIDDGDVSGAIAVGLPETGIDLYMGSGGAGEGVLAAAGLKCLGGQMEGRLLPRNDSQRAEAHRLGITDVRQKWSLEEMARGEVMFAATGITDGFILQGVRSYPGGASTASIVMRSLSGTVRRVMAQHDFAKLAKSG